MVASYRYPQRDDNSSDSVSYSFHLSSNERPAQLSPLDESVEVEEETFSDHNYLARVTNDNIKKSVMKTPSIPLNSISNRNPDPNTPHYPPSINPGACDGGDCGVQNQSGSNGSSPSTRETGMADFMGTEFYMDESLPSSLSEHPVDVHQQAMVSLLQFEILHKSRRFFSQIIYSCLLSKLRYVAIKNFSLLFYSLLPIVARFSKFEQNSMYLGKFDEGSKKGEGYLSRRLHYFLSRD
ncbi:uncharacterized protein LOC125500145 [Athalia rosae]|uniref:uncharacterized protein LOC125500145 n=1 Tax=Athalia rosae TaxID=37344 RepID=UPI002033A627|nr:uncharacterized protein LOC125500145 [Athalia rosae]